jgi:hypothetical protein
MIASDPVERGPGMPRGPNPYPLTRAHGIGGRWNVVAAAPRAIPLTQGFR